MDLPTLQQVTDEVTESLSKNEHLKSRVAFDFGDFGFVLVDATQRPVRTSNERGAADCTMVISIENFIAMNEGRLNSTAAFMSGKLKIKGDTKVAMTLDTGGS